MAEASVTATVEIRCDSPSCTTPGGKVLYRGSPAGLGIMKRRCRNTVVMIGLTVAIVCGCGAVWRNDTARSAFDALGD